jgi:hypothetical protein
MTPRPDTAGIQAAIDRYLGGAPDLYQRSVDPETGAVTLRYFFPAVAAARDAEAIAAISAAIGAPVTAWPQPHQGQLAQAALDGLPVGLSVERAPAIFLESGLVEVRCTGTADPGDLSAAEAVFAARTGLRLRIVTAGVAPERLAPAAGASFAPPPGAARSELNFALSTARGWFGPETGCYKASADQATNVVTLRFHFPEVAREQHATQLAALAAYIGWTVQLWPQPHQEALSQAARAALPPGLTVVGAPALHGAAREVVVRVQGAVSAEACAEAVAAFAARTGWTLTLRDR